MALLLRRRHRLLAIVQLAVALWLAATSGYRCELAEVAPPAQLVDGSHTPVTPPREQSSSISSSSQASTREYDEPK